MRLAAHVAFALVALGCEACSAPSSSSDTPAVMCPVGQHSLASSCAWNPVVVAIGPGADTSGCPTFSPNPASAHENQLVEWINNTSATLAVYQYEGTNNGVAPLPLTTVSPGQTSGGVFWSNAETVAVYKGGCNSASGGDVIITVN